MGIFSKKPSQKKGLVLIEYERRESEVDDDYEELNDNYSFELVGESFHRETLLKIINSHKAIHKGELEIEALMLKEPDNKFDPFAVRVLIEGHQVGHVSKEYSLAVTEFIESFDADGIRLSAIIGWNTNNPNPPIGVRLNFNF